MKILVTGAKGFVGRNLCAQLRNIRDGKVNPVPVEIGEVYEYDIDTPSEKLDEWCASADFVLNLAGANRPTRPEEFMNVNYGFTADLLANLIRHGNRCPVMLSSSSQAALDNPYGKSKRAGEKLLEEYSAKTGATVYIYRFTNIFGKWCRPNYNSVVATFCHNIARNLPIQINDPSTLLNLVYIDDVVEELTRAITGHPTHGEDGFCHVPVTHQTTLGELADTLRKFNSFDEDREVPDLTPGSLSRKLHSTFLSYLPADRMVYDLNMHIDGRGSFTEIVRTAAAGQISVNVSSPGITKGEHWHHSKNEKFIVVRGNGLIRMRKEGDSEILDFRVSGDRLQAVQIPPGYTHNIINLSDTEDLVTLIWCDETFDPSHPDTFRDPV